MLITAAQHAQRTEKKSNKADRPVTDGGVEIKDYYTLGAPEGVSFLRKPTKQAAVACFGISNGMGIGLLAAKLAEVSPLQDTLGPYFAAAAIGGTLGAMAGATLEKIAPDQRMPMPALGAAVGTCVATCAAAFGGEVGVTLGSQVILTGLGALAGWGIVSGLVDKIS